MTPWAALSLASLAVALTFLAIVATRRRLRGPAYPLIAFMASMAVWSLGESIVRLLPDSASYDVILGWIKVQWVGIAFVSATLLHFMVRYTDSTLGDRNWFLPVLYASAAVVAGLIAFSDAIVSGWTSTPFGPQATFGPRYLPAAVLWTGILAASWIVLAVAYVRGDRLFRQRCLPVLVALTVIDVLGPLTETFWPFLTESPTGLGFVSAYIFALSLTLMYAETRLHFLPITAVTETSPVEKVRGRLEVGLSHLFLSRNRDPCFAAFRELVGRVPGLCISGVYPQRLQEEYGLQATPILWLTNMPQRGLSARPSGLEFEVQLTAMRFIRENPATAVLVDDLDFLTITNGFDAVARFVKRLANHAATHGSALLACADPDAFSPQHLSILRAIFDRVLEFAPPAPRGTKSEVDGPGALLLEGPSSDALEVYRSLAGSDPGVIVSTKNPERLRRLYGVSTPILWLSESPEEGISDSPVVVDLDAAKLAMTRFGDQLHPTMFLPDLELLTLVTSFPKALEFMKGLIDHMAVRNGVLVASLEPHSWSPGQLAIVRRRFDRVRSLA